MRSKIPVLTEALDGRFTPHHGFLISMHLRLFDEYSQAPGELDARIEEAMEPFRGAREQLFSTPGFSTTVAEVFLTETGADYFTQRQPAKTKARAINQLQALGYHVALQPLAATA